MPQTLHKAAVWPCLCECSWVSPCAASISLQPRPRALLPPPHPEAQQSSSITPHSLYLSIAPTKPMSPLLTPGEFLQIRTSNSWEWKRFFFSLSHSISVRWRDWSSLTEIAKIVGNLGNAVGVKRLNRPLWAWPSYVHLTMVHLSKKGNRSIWIFQSTGTYSQWSLTLCLRCSSNSKEVPMEQGIFACENKSGTHHQGL